MSLGRLSSEGTSIKTKLTLSRVDQTFDASRKPSITPLLLITKAIPLVSPVENATNLTACLSFNV